MEHAITRFGENRDDPKGLAAEKAAPLPQGPPYHDLDFLAGTWSEKEANELLKIVSEFRRIDPEIWQ